MKNWEKTIIIIGIVILFIASITIIMCFSPKIVFEEEHLIQLNGKLDGYKRSFIWGVHEAFDVQIDGSWYKMRGIEEKTIMSLVGKSISFITEVDVTSFSGVTVYNYIGMYSKEPIFSTEIKETNILTNDQQSYLGFSEWLEDKHPIIFKLLWNRYQRLN